MTDQSRYNQFDVNRSAHKTSQDVIRQLTLFTYDAVKFVVNFIASMIKMATGK